MKKNLLLFSFLVVIRPVDDSFSIPSSLAWFPSAECALQKKSLFLKPKIVAQIFFSRPVQNCHVMDPVKSWRRRTQKQKDVVQ